MFDMIPVMRYDRRFGWMIVGPSILSPLLLLLIYPPFYFCSMAKSKIGQSINNLICGIIYLPLCLLQLIIFVIPNVVLIPIAYIFGVAKLITSNPYLEGKTQKYKWCRVFGFFIFGLPILVLAQLPDTFFCVYALYSPQLTKTKRSSVKKDEQVRRDFLDALER